MINLRNAREYIENFLRIRTKDAQIVPFKMNRAQRRMYEALQRQYLKGVPLRIIVLKARQLGFSTLAEALIFQRTATKKNVDSLIVAHREDSTANLFRMSKRFYDYLPPELKPMISASNAQELLFENPNKKTKQSNPGLGSRIRCNTAGGSGIGRSDTLQNLHASEFAFWRGDKLDTLLGAMQAIPANPETLIIIESTANGFDEFKIIWDAAVAGENDFIPLFFPWFENPEYAMDVPPGIEFTENEREIQSRFELTDKQLYWRRWCIKNNCAGDERKFRQEYPATADEAFLTTGDGVFDNELVMKLRVSAPEPLHIGEFEYDYDGITITNIKWVDNPKGCIRIYREPQEHRPYVLGGDTAGDGSDWFTALVIDNISGKWCAVLHKQYGEAEYARQIYCLGFYFNKALVGIEANYSTYPIMELDRMNYPNQYVRERADTYTGQIKPSYGFRTDGITRPVIIAGLIEMFRNYPEYFIDFETLGEMLTFIKNEKGRPEALVGKHDDLIMAAAITYGIRGQQKSTEDEAGFSMKDWTPDMIEDYERASDSEKQYLRKMWGRKKENADENN